MRRGNREVSGNAQPGAFPTRTQRLMEPQTSVSARRTIDRRPGGSRRGHPGNNGISAVDGIKELATFWTPMALPGPSRPSLLSRTTALLAIVLVLALSVLAASPELHDRLHGRGPSAAGAVHGDGAPASHPQDSQDDDGCVVTLFSQGVVLALAVAALPFTGEVLRLSDFELVDRIIPEAPRYLLLPTQAPPLGLS